MTIAANPGWEDLSGIMADLAGLTSFETMQEAVFRVLSRRLDCTHFALLLERESHLTVCLLAGFPEVAIEQHSGILSRLTGRPQNTPVAVPGLNILAALPPNHQIYAFPLGDRAGCPGLLLAALEDPASSKSAALRFLAGQVALLLPALLHLKDLESGGDSREERRDSDFSEWERKTFTLGKANVELLAIQERLEAQNQEMTALLEENRRRQKELQSILDSSPAVIVMVNKEGCIGAVNSRVVEILGMPKAEVLGMNWDDFLPQLAGRFEDPRAFLEFLERLNEMCPGDLEDSAIESFYNQIHDLPGPPPRKILPILFALNQDNESDGSRLLVLNDVTKMHQADQLLRTILAASPIPCLVSRVRDGEILYTNGPMATTLGYAPEELIGRKAPDIYVDPQDREALLGELKNGDGPRDREVRIRDREGNEYWVILSMATTHLGEEEVVIGAFYDITARLQAAEKLRLYHNIFLNSNDAIAILSPDGRILEANPALEKNYGYTLEELVNQTPAILGGQANLDQIRQQFGLRGIYNFRREISLNTRDGKPKTVELSMFPLFDEGGNLLKQVGIARDITERKLVEAALLKAHAELERRVEQRTAELAEVNRDLKAVQDRNNALLDAIPDIMMRVDREGIILDYKAPKDNDLAENAERVIGRNFRDFVPEPIAGPITETIRAVLDTGEAGSVEYQLPHGQHQHFFEARVVGSGPNEVMGIVRDITDKKAVEEALRQARDKLEERVVERTSELARTNRELREAQAQLVQSEKMASLGLLVAGIAHEINTPVGAINSMHNTMVRALEKVTSLIAEEEPNLLERLPKLARLMDTIAEANRVIASGSERVTGIVKRLRSFARLDEAVLTAGDVHEGIEDTLVLIHHEIKHHIKVETDFRALPRVSFYPGRLNQVILNLLINAKQAMTGNCDGVITIRTRHEDGLIKIIISDNGVGIPPEHLSRIFDPGFTTKGVGVGTGLGLSIIYQSIHEDHRRDIRVTSEPGEGATFTISFPDNLDEIVEHT